ncbi:hypothetical protein CWC31_00940 [Pseudoalteromonas ruthenica]|uniref:hypothetical protein n=1 Tax=Pseudoalteromonas ruthenica TaxID=151081 RepID=UPI00110A02CA|nr:hypothetical protein [Pseudoalteromonas ruthenica]TLX52434.1 hypothetical protein CWC31_00940 [Pseudoalteromonas ruthenica]
MKNEEVGRLGVACILAVLGALVEAQSDYCKDFDLFRNPILWWLLMIIGAGVTLNAAKGSSKKVLLASSALTTTCFFSVAAFMFLLDQSNNFCFSGVTANHPAFELLAGFVFLATIGSIFLLSHSTPILKSIVTVAANSSTTEKIENIEKAIRALIGLAAAILLILQIK